jgi:hypothetical protein
MASEDFAQATRDYARWLSGYLTLDPAGLAEKRVRMGKGAFPFLRATFYRWRWQFDAVDAAVRGAPALLGTGDAHLENFGTWRDAEGRLVWGVNDFDEAVELPFTSDLVRLATSLLLARKDEKAGIHVGREDGIAAILDGYREALPAGTPFILERPEHEALRAVAVAHANPGQEWTKIRAEGEAGVPEDAALRHVLLTALPQGSKPDEVFRKASRGLGSLGRPRWRVLATLNGGPVAREAKAAAPSAWLMPESPASRITDHRRRALEARRAPDPGFLLTERWVVRRLSPEARKIEMKDLAKAAADPVPGQLALLRAMGGELANLHAGTARDPRAILDWLGAQPSGWLSAAAGAARDRVLQDLAAFGKDPGVVEWLPAAPRA